MAAHPLARIAARRDRVLAAVERVLTPPADGENVGRIVDAVLEVLPKKIDYSAIYRSFNFLVGEAKPDSKSVRDACWAVAANTAALRLGRIVWPAQIPAKPTTVTMQFLASQRLPDRSHGKPAGFPIRYRLRVLQGPGSPAEIETRLSSRFVSYLAARPQGLGFARPPRGNRLPTAGRPYQHYETLVGMLVRAELSVDDEGRTKIDNLRCSSSMIEYNRALTEMRWRSTFQCPFNYDHPCHYCVKGQKSCRIATHPDDHQTRLCPGCLTESEFDVYWSDPVCRKCVLNLKRRGQ